MLIHNLVKKDNAIYWEKVAVDDDGESVFAEPIIIKCRWDQVQHDSQDEDFVVTETKGNTVYPDRVLTIGSFLALGDDEVLDEMAYELRQDPRLVTDARRVQSQSTIFELGWEQVNPKPGYKSEHMTVECHVG